MGFPRHNTNKVIKPLVAVVGPTGSGKSQLALVLAKSFSGEIINYDSVQMYRGLDIGSAKVPLAERQAVPHHLLDVASAGEELTAGDFVRLAREALAVVDERDALPVLAGGTGFYLRSLLAGLSPAPERNPELRTRLAKVAGRRPAALHRFLRKRDPRAAARIHSNDVQKLMRAIELSCERGERPPREALAGYSVLRIGLNPARPELYRRLDERSAYLFQHGILEETKALLDSGVSPYAKPLLSLGYKQAVAVLTRGMPLGAVIEECRTRTRQYAKRQMTWFRAEPDVQWLSGFGDEVWIQEQAVELTREFLSR
jgi:tRNA dimethylallyltransferase